MDVEVNDRDAFGAVALAGVEAGDRHVVENAEAHGAAGFRVVAARAHLGERVANGALVRHHGVDGREPGADRAQGGLPGLGR